MTDYTNPMFNEYSDVDDWEEYDTENEEYAPPTRIVTKNVPEEPPEEKKRREAKHEAEVTAMRERLNWIDNKEKPQSVKIENDEFPSIGSAAKPQTKKSMPKFTKSTVKTKFVINGSSYEKQAQDYQRKEITEQAERTKAFETLADKEELEKKLIKTRMCNSIDKNEKCPHGENCRFAHSLDELNISNCLFGNQCRFVIIGVASKLTNGKKCCTHKHPGETKEEFYTRTGLDRYRKAPPKLMVPSAVLTNMASVKETEFKQDRNQGINWAEKIKPPVQHQTPKVPPVQPVQHDETEPKVPLVQPAQHDETVLKVPRELAVQAMELALKSGKKNIRVEVI